MTPKQIAELETPMTDKALYEVMSVGAEGTPAYNNHEAADIDVCRRLEQDRAALMAALEKFLVLRSDARDFAAFFSAACFHAEETLAAVRQRQEAKDG